MTASGDVMVTGHGTVPTAAHETGTPLHEERGVNTALLGMLLFIASEVMFFGGLFAVYFNVRAANRVWPPEGFHVEALPIPLIATIILVVSSFTMQRAVWRIRANDRTGMNRALLVTLLLGIVFLAIQLYDYTTLGFGLSSGVYGSLFYTMTGFHGAHVFGGVIGILVVMLRGMAGQFSAGHHVAVEAVSIYWHFVDVVWIALFTTLYLLR
ncbi:MAG: heme-copper oxidase subunit III [Chloroflexi bacterium]|nr:heme-copper oxidase subunit III [Chloroflexota bacterium]